MPENKGKLRTNTRKFQFARVTIPAWTEAHFKPNRQVNFKIGHIEWKVDCYAHNMLPKLLVFLKKLTFWAPQKFWSVMSKCLHSVYTPKSVRRKSPFYVGLRCLLFIQVRPPALTWKYGKRWIYNVSRIFLWGGKCMY